jgi:hypothetical protein
VNASVEERRGQVEQATADREAVEALGWRERRQKLPHATENERLYGERLTEETAKLAQIQPPGSEVRREVEIAEQLLATRSAQALTAARIKPPAYIVKELGERPADPIKARTWDRGVQGIERYRLEHGVRDRGSAFGRESQDTVTREAAQRSLAEAQRRLGLERQLTPSRERPSIERDLGIGL